MKHIWAPWRMEYIQKEKSGECILCVKPGEDKDIENYILFRGKKNYVMLNSYPYNPGHLLIAPFRHVASVEDFTGSELHEHYEIVEHCVAVLRKECGPEGFNIGTNIGKVAGAGIERHVHTHIVPRWNGDNNFMPVITDTRVIPEALANTYKRLHGKF